MFFTAVFPFLLIDLGVAGGFPFFRQAADARPFKGRHVDKDVLIKLSGWIKPKPFWLLKNLTVPVLLFI